MSVATSTAIAISLGAAGAAGSIAKAKIESNAAKKAAQQQVAGGERAQAFTERAYRDQQQIMSPYVSLGQDAMARMLESQWGPGAGARGAPPAGMGGAAPNAFGGAPVQAAGGPPVPRFGGTGPSMGGPSTAMQGPPQGQPQGPQGQLVTIQAPTGETRAVPAAQAQAYVARGARVIG